MSSKHLFAASAGFLVLSIVACGPVFGPRSGELCDLATYRPRCTDGVAIECSPGSDCSHDDCASWGCSCSSDPRISRDDCNESGKRCVVDHDGARCE